MLASKISIADLLEAVKSTYRSILSTDVLDKLGEERNNDGYYSDRVRYSVNDHYLEAVNSGDMKSAQRLVDEATER